MIRKDDVNKTLEAPGTEQRVPSSCCVQVRHTRLAVRAHWAEHCSVCASILATVALILAFSLLC